MNPMERKELAVRVAVLINEGKIDPIQMALATPEGRSKYVNVIVLPAPLTDVCNHSNIIKADCIAWCGSCGVITWASDAIERVPGADAIARQKWCDENVVAWGCTNEASGRKCCKRWCQQRYCPVSLRADSGTGGAG